MFLHHLKTLQNPSDSGTRLQLVETVLREITQFFYNAEGNPGNSIISSFSDSWPAICSRLYELHGHNKTSVRSSSSSPEKDVLSLILTFITTVSQWPDMTTCLRAPRQLEQVISILARIWTSESKSKPKNLDIPSSHALVSFMHSGTENAYMEETACAFITYFQTRSTVAKLLLGHLETSSKWHAPYYKHFNSDAFLVGLLIAFDEELKECLLLHSSIRKYIAALNGFLARTPDANVAKSVFLCLKYFHATLDATDGFTWVKQLLRAGILPALFDCAKFYEHDGVEEAVVSLLSYGISRYLVYKSVLREANKSWSEILSKEMSPLWATGQNPTAWNEFVKLVIERREIKWEYNRNIKNATCALPQVSSDVRSRMRRSKLFLVYNFRGGHESV